MGILSSRWRTSVSLALVMLLAFDRHILRADDAVPDAPLTAREQKFNRELFTSHTDASVEAMQTRLQRALKRRIETLDRQLSLSENQKRKFELAGRGSIKQLIDAIDEQRKSFASIERDDVNGFRFFHEEPAMATIRKMIRTGPFDEESLFCKTLRSTLTAEQTARQQQLSELAGNSNKPITLQVAGDLLKTSQIQRDVYRIAWNRSGPEVALVQFNKEVELFTLPLREPIRTIEQVKSAVDFDFDPDGQRVVIAENSTNARLIKVSDNAEVLLDAGQSQPAVHFSPDGKMVVTGGYGTAVKLWSATTGELVREIQLPAPEGARTPVFSPDGTILAVGNRNSTTALIDVTSGKTLRLLGKNMSHQLCFDPSGKTIAVTYVDGSLILWDAATGKIQKSVQAWANELYTVDWSPDGSLLVTGGYHTPVTLWNSVDLSIINELESREWVMDAKFSPDGTRLLLATMNRDQADRYVETWAVP